MPGVYTAFGNDSGDTLMPAVAVRVTPIPVNELSIIDIPVDFLRFTESMNRFNVINNNIRSGFRWRLHSPDTIDCNPDAFEAPFYR